MDRGAKVDAQDNMGAGPLHRYDVDSRMRLLVGYGDRSRMQYAIAPSSKCGRAASLGHLNMVKFLLEQRASVHLLDRGNNTPLCVLSHSISAKFDSTY